jgi:hypothetical protein
MILQRDEQLLQQINEWGCYYMDLLFAVNKYTNRGFDQDLINRLYATLGKHGWMDDECTILAPDSITRFLELDTRIVIEGGTHKLPPQREPGADEFEVQRWTYESLSHFVFFDPADGTCYDSWGVSKCLSRGAMADKRVFRRTA